MLQHTKAACSLHTSRWGRSLSRSCSIDTPRFMLDHRMADAGRVLHADLHLHPHPNQ